MGSSFRNLGYMAQAFWTCDTALQVFMRKFPGCTECVYEFVVGFGAFGHHSLLYVEFWLLGFRGSGF